MTTAYVGSLFQLGAAPVLESAMSFAESRHRLILSNIANADTPDYRRQDLDAHRFERDLARAVEDRDRRHPGLFRLPEDPAVPVSSRGGTLPGRRILDFEEGPLRHDANNVSLDKEMALLAQNSGGYSTYAGLLRKAYGQIRAAISERPGEG